jgi:hypothetical protein
MIFFVLVIFSFYHLAEDYGRWLEKPLAEQRKDYFCNGRFVSLDDIPTWPQYFAAELARGTKRNGDEGKCFLLLRLFRRSLLTIDVKTGQKVGRLRGDIGVVRWV